VRTTPTDDVGAPATDATALVQTASAQAGAIRAARRRSLFGEHPPETA